MTVLKSKSSTALIRDAVVLDLSDVARQAVQMREAAQKRARQIITDAEAAAKKNAQQIETDAQERGRTAGYEAGLVEGRKTGHDEAFASHKAALDQLQQNWTRAAGDWDARRAEMERDARSAVLDFALTFAEKITHRVVQTDRSVVVDQVAAALANVTRPLDVTIRTHPGDRAALTEALPALHAALPQLQHVHLADDEAIAPGGCVVTYGQGRIDAAIQTQIDRIVDLIRPVDEQAQQA